MIQTGIHVVRISFYSSLDGKYTIIHIAFIGELIKNWICNITPDDDEPHDSLQTNKFF